MNAHLLPGTALLYDVALAVLRLHGGCSRWEGVPPGDEESYDTLVQVAAAALRDKVIRVVEALQSGRAHAAEVEAALSELLRSGPAACPCKRRHSLTPAAIAGAGSARRTSRSAPTSSRWAGWRRCGPPSIRRGRPRGRRCRDWPSGRWTVCAGWTPTSTTSCAARPRFTAFSPRGVGAG